MIFLKKHGRSRNVVRRSKFLAPGVWSTLESGAMTKLLMVCMANTCRSPMAQAVAHKLAVEAGLAPPWKVDCAGTHAHRLGEPPDPRAELTLVRHGYQMRRARSRRITVLDFESFDLILAMDASNLSELRRLCPTEQVHKLRLLLDFAEGHSERDVPDPYYGNQEGFEHVLALCEAGARGLIRHCR